jgi:pyroglutamyl-peptidase
VAKAKAQPSVIFMHVPDLSSSESKLQEGWEVSVALIKALVESRRKVGGALGKQNGEGVEQEDDTRNNTAG